MGMRKKKILIAALTVILSLPLTGCASDLINYITRENPYDAMEEYIEEKYGIEVEVVDTNFDTGYMQMFWQATGFGATVTCDELPGQEIGVAAEVTENNEYYFYDDYQRCYHIVELQNIIKQLEQKYLSNYNYCIKVYQIGDMDTEEVQMMSLAEYTGKYERYAICLLGNEKNSNQMSDIAQKMAMELKQQGIFCQWDVGVVSDKIQNIEEYEMVDGVFRPWYSGRETQWLLEMSYGGDWEAQTEEN